jgi:hypothetical protein
MKEQAIKNALLNLLGHVLGKLYPSLRHPQSACPSSFVVTPIPAAQTGYATSFWEAKTV